jgi:hypothetical protein
MCSVIVLRASWLFLSTYHLEVPWRVLNNGMELHVSGALQVYFGLDLHSLVTELYMKGHVLQTYIKTCPKACVFIGSYDVLCLCERNNRSAKQMECTWED